ncbi:MAG: IPT/TIG domain-containing protein [Bacteroidetes bacterium]|nr:IPT/TIG domain-containing protein [Bacteroidota bacterium]
MKYSLVFVILSLLFSFMGCKKDAEIQPKQYPYVITKSVTDIDSSGATFEAEILDYGQEEITDFGFIWSDTKTNYQYSLFNKGSLDNFKVRISADLEQGITYSCRAYIKTIRNLVLGNKVIFLSLGSESIMIGDFNPKEGFDGTLIKLTGKYFSQISANNKVFVNHIPAEVIFSTGDSIAFITPPMGYVGEADISIQVGSKDVTSNIKFKILGPQIDSISLLSGNSGESVTIEGKNLIQNGANIAVYFDSNSAEIVSYSETQLEIIVPPPTNSLLSDISVTIKLVNGLKTTSYKDRFLIEKSWESKQATPFDWSWAYKAFTFNEKGYILELNTKELYEYSPISNQWNSVPSSLFPGDRNEGSLYIITAEQLFKVSGYDYTGQSLSELWVFDFNDKSWNKKNDIPFKFYNAIFFNLNNQLYIVTDEGQVWKCNLENGQYIRLNDFPDNFKYAFASSFVSNGKAFVVTYGLTWQYNEQNDSWIEKSTNPFSKQNYCVHAIGFALNNTGYVLHSGEKLYKYDIINNKWILTSMYPGPSGYDSYKTIFIIGDKAYIAATSSSYIGCAPLMYSYQE